MFYIFIILQFLPFIIVPVVIISACVRASRNKTNTNNTLPDFENTISNANDLEAHWNSISSEDASIYCDYCGSKMERVRKRCPSCGARVQSKNK